MKGRSQSAKSLVPVALLVAVLGCSSTPPVWTAKHVRTLAHFKTPESVCVDPATGFAYVSNIEAENEAWWADDGKGFISRLKPEGDVDEMRWVEATCDGLLNAPKGMCILNGRLHVTDNTRVAVFLLATGAAGLVTPVPGSKKVNDAASDGANVWFSDSAASRIHRMEAGGLRQIKAPQGANGITFHDGRMFCVSWALHDVYELDASGKEAPKPFGLAHHFTNLDGIEILDDGTFLVSDFTGNKVCTISPDRRTVRTLVTVETPADIGLDRRRSLLYVPQFMKDRVVIYKLQRQ